jgi:hypothetical protein
VVDGYNPPNAVVYGTVAYVRGLDGKYRSVIGATQAVTAPSPKRIEDGF